MSYVLPTFNLNVNIWRNASGPPAPPAVTTIGNLAWGRRVQTGDVIAAIGTIGGAITLLVPAGTDVRDEGGGWGDDWVEVPAGSGRFYEVLWVDDIGKGFANEHRAAVLIKTAAFGQWPVPYP